MATQAQILEQIQEMLAAILPQGAPRVSQCRMHLAFVGLTANALHQLAAL